MRTPSVQLPDHHPLPVHLCKVLHLPFSGYSPTPHGPCRMAGSFGTKDALKTYLEEWVGEEYGRYAEGLYNNRDLRAISWMADAALKTLEEAGLATGDAQSLKAR